MGLKKRKTPEHPALPLMRYEANGHLVRFITDLTAHDAAALAQHKPHDAFAWIVHTGATWLTFMGPSHRTFRFAGVFVGSYGADECKFFFWDGAVFAQYRSANDLDDRIARYEENVRERAHAGDLADRGL